VYLANIKNKTEAMAILKKFFKWLGRLALLLLLGAVAWWGLQKALKAHRERQPMGKLTINTDLNRSYSFGKFDLVISFSFLPSF
jgi:flagellar biogenesis protein FliO